MFDGRFEGGVWARAPHDSRALRTLVVDGASPRASDDNPGTGTSPFRTIRRAVLLARPGTRVLIRAGTYRETVRLRRANSGAPGAPVVIQAERPGTVVLAGSDVWEGWEKAGRPGVFTHRWDRRWEAGPDVFGAAAPMGLAARRREMIFVDGKPLRQVLTDDGLRPGTFSVSEADRRVLIRLPEGADARRSRIEVATRPAALDLGSLWRDSRGADGWPEDFVLRGLVFRHYTQPTYGEAAVPAYGRRFLIEDCDIGWNNAAGLALRGADFVVRRTRIHDNGFLGVSIPPTSQPAAERFVLQDCEVARNNWRGAMGGFFGFAVAGVKIMTSRDYVLRRVWSHGNACPGVWLDKENRNVLVERCRLTGNRRGPGLWVEISEGPVAVRDSTLAYNQSGMFISNSSEVSLEGCVLFGNATAQIGEWSPAIDREGFRDVGLALRNNVIACASRGGTLFQRPAYPEIYSTLRSDGNLWWSWDGLGWQVGERRLDFSGWISETGQDLHSLEADPRFRHASALDWRPGPGSPLRHPRREWGNRRVVAVYPKRSLVEPGTKAYLHAYSGTGTIRYTLDGSLPTPRSPAYRGPIAIVGPGAVRARLFGESADPRDPVAGAWFVERAPPVPNVPLSDLVPLKSVVGWGREARRDRSIEGKPLYVGGMAFDRGLGAHADSEIVYPVVLRARRFVSVIGIDDEADRQEVRPAVEFLVYADSERIYRSGRLAPGALRAIDVALPRGCTTLRLIVKSVSGSTEWAHVDWVRCGFETD